MLCKVCNGNTGSCKCYNKDKAVRCIYCNNKIEWINFPNWEIRNIDGLPGDLDYLKKTITGIYICTHCPGHYREYAVINNEQYIYNINTCCWYNINLLKSGGSIIIGEGYNAL